MKNKQLLSSALLLTAAVIWGFAFVAQESLADTVPPFTVNALRSLIASVALIPVAAVTRRINGKKLTESDPKDRRLLIKAGVICGVMLCISVNLQQFGISLYPPGAPASAHSGFLTALYIIFVPIFGLFLKKKPGFTIIVAVILATAGLYFLCLYDGFGSLYTGDIVVLICGMAFAVQILCVDHYIDRVDGVKLSSIQFLVTGILSAVLMLIFEKPDINAILAAWKPLLYLALMSSGVGYTLQIIGQKYSSSPALASILMSMESVFAVIGGVIFLGAIPSANEWIGCALMFAAIIIAQLPKKTNSKKPTVEDNLSPPQNKHACDSDQLSYKRVFDYHSLSKDTDKGSVLGIDPHKDVVQVTLGYTHAAVRGRLVRNVHKLSAAHSGVHRLTVILEHQRVRI